MKKNIKVALVHDDLVQWGGAERMLAALSQIFPEAPIYTSVFDHDSRILREQFQGKKIITSFIQKIPGWKKMYRMLLPLYVLAFEGFDFSEFDLVISQTTRFAKAIITKPETTHISYIHTPPRFLWDFSGGKIKGFPQLFFAFQRILDQIISSRVDVWVAGSKNAQDRIKKIYRVESQIIYPFVDGKKFSHIYPFDGGYYLVVSRLNNYKRVDLIIQAANELGITVKIVGTGPQEKKLKDLAGPNIHFLGSLDEESLALLVSGCRALIIAADEDFGLMPLEAQSFFKPVIAFKKGGVLETVIDGETGIFFNVQSVDSLKEALVKLDKQGYNKTRCRDQARLFSKDRFIKEFSILIDPTIKSLN